jgi:hypothetical protein
MMYTYRVHGQTVSSEIELPELMPGSSTGAPDITISKGFVDTADIEPSRIGGRTFDNGDSVFSWAELCASRISRDGSSITFHPLQELEPGVQRLALLGPPLAIALRNKGYLVLHATALEVGDGACLFMGTNKAGKSTMATAMHLRNHRLIADDIVALKVDLSGSSPILAMDGIKRCKLWPDSAEALGIDDHLLQPLHSFTQKLGFSKGIDDEVAGGTQVKRLIALQRSDRLEMKRLHGNNIVTALLANCYVPKVGDAFVGEHGMREFMQCARLAREADVYELHRPTDLAQLPAVCEFVERHVAQADTAAV